MKDSRFGNREQHSALPDFRFSILHTSAADFQRDLGRYWRHVRRAGGIMITQQGWVYKNNFKALLSALNATGTPAEEQLNGRLNFIRRLLMAMKELAQSANGSRLVAISNSRLFDMPMAARVKWTFEIWRDGGMWNELLRLPIPISEPHFHPDAPPALGKAHLALVRIVGRTAGERPTEWIALTDFIARVKSSDYEFLFERRHRSQPANFYNSPYYGPNNPYSLTFLNVRNEASGWDAVERAFIVNVLTGPLHWMGLVELGYDPAEGGERGENAAPLAFRLTEAGRWLLCGGEPPTFTESGGKIIVQPNFTILALEPISDAVLNDLDRFAEPQGGERAITYHLTRESLYAGQQSGWDAAQVIEFLEAHQGARIPLNVRRSLEEWEATHRRITFHRNACVVQFADAEAASELADALSAFDPHSLGARFTLIKADSADAVVDALQRTGWSPLVQPAGETSARAVLRADDDGRVTFAQAAPSVYALGKLAQFAEANPQADEQTRWVITAASVRAAMSQGMQVDQLMGALAEMHIGPIPPGLEAKIRAWAAFFGNATLRHVVLLELNNADVLANLLDDPQVGQYLSPIEGSVAPLAIVESSHADEVRQLLSERGINVR